MLFGRPEVFTLLVLHANLLASESDIRSTP